MAQYSMDIPQERESILQIQEEVLKHPGISLGGLLKGRSVLSVGPAIEFLLKTGKVRQEIVRDLKDPMEADRFFPIYGTVFSDKLRP